MGSKTTVDKEVVIFIDKQQFKIEDRPYTARELLELAKEDPSETTLVRRHGDELTKYTDPDEIVEVKNGTHFLVFHNGPTPVS